jgi:predicted AAA+ superfamily ATPase
LTAVAYDSLLAGLYVVEEVPAWLTNRLSRLAKTSKRYVVDTSLVAAALGLTRDTLLKDGDLLGRMIDTFVAAQIRPELEVASTRARLFHLREKNGRHEVDLLPELSAHGVVGIEVKASAAPSRDDAKHLLWLRDELGERFAAGAVLHTGPGSFVIDDRVYAVPIASLWSAGNR